MRLQLYLIIFMKSMELVDNAFTYPGPISKIQVIVGAGFPLELESRNVVMGYVLKTPFLLPPDIGNITNAEAILKRKKRNTFGRWKFYSFIASVVGSFGLDGKACLLQTICELSQAPLERRSLIEELLHVVLTPSSAPDKLVDGVDKDYHSAEQIGKNLKGSCQDVYPECTVSLVRTFTKWK